MTDVVMPKSPAASLQAEFKKRGINLPVIFLTASVSEKSYQLARINKATGVFQKPVDGGALLDAITWALQAFKNNGERPGKSANR